jgi:hypothetical protein
MKVRSGDKVVFFKKGWKTLSYGSSFIVLDVTWLKSIKYVLINNNDEVTYVRAKHFGNLKN